VRNDVPGGESVGEFPPSGVERVGGVRAKGLIERLRARICALEQVPVSLALPPVSDAGPARPACSLPSPALARLPSPNQGEGLPLTKLAKAGLHEIKAATYRDAPAALSFALAVIGERLARREKAQALILWCLTANAAREWGRPYGPGLLALGLDPALLLIVEANTAQDAAWALEEGLKSGALAAALGQVELKVPLFARRLGLAAKAARTPCLLLSGHQASGLPGTLTRWRVRAGRSSAAPFDAAAPGSPSWRLTLERCRGMAPMQSFIVELSHGQDRFRLAAAIADRAAEAAEEGVRARA
jgi:protein ImuA